MRKNHSDTLAYRRKWYAKNKKRVLEQVYKYRNNKIAKFKKFKSKLKCSRCNESHIACLEFHHKNPKEKELSISTMIRSYGWSRVIKEIKKCIVLCANCHRKEHYQEAGVG